MPYRDHEEGPDFDDDEDEEGVTCKRCGEEGLYWQRITCADGRSERSALFDLADNRAHECRAKSDDFEDVSHA